MSYLVLARKCRPTRFSEVVGQNHVTQTLANAIKMDRVAHGFLFSGVRGVGKTSLARILAKCLNCKDGPTDNPCGVCESCKTITEGTAVDVIEIDGASNNSVDDIRDLRETVPYRPIIGRFKIYVIDEVHMLSVNAFNALLKTLEEPPPHVKFIFATTEPHKIPSTILSRIQRYDFRRISTSAIIGRIKEILTDEGIEAEDAAMAIVGREADGSMRDAMSVLDQVLAAGEKRITAQYVAVLLGVVGRQTFFELSAALIANNPARCLEIIQDIDKQGFDIPTFTKGLLEHLRNLVVTAVCGNDIGFLELPQEELDTLKEQAKSTSTDTLHRMFKHISDAYDEIARSAFPKILLEAVLARTADLGTLVPAAELLHRLETLSRANPTPQAQAPAQTGGPANQLPVKKNFETQSEPQSVASQSSRFEPPTHVTQQVPDGPVSTPPAQAAPTQRPSTAPPAAPSPGERPLTKAEWEKLLVTMGQRLPAKASLLERANFGAQSTTANITVQFDKSDAFTAEQAQEPALIKELESFLGTCLKGTVRLNVEVRDLGANSTLAQKKLKSQEQIRKMEETARNHPVIRGFESALGGKISKVRLNR